MKLFDVPGKLVVEWREDVRAIWDKWLSYSVSLSEFREGIMVQGLEHAKRHGAIAWIADGSEATGVFTSDIHDYIAKDVFASFARIGIKHFVSVQPKSALAKLGVKHYESELGPHGIQLVEAASFDAAIAFLKGEAKRGT